MSKDYISEFGALVDALSRNSAVEILKLSKPPAPDSRKSAYAFRKLTAEHGYKLEERFKDYFDVSAGTHLRFVYSWRGDIAVGGEFHLYQLYDALLSEDDPQLWYEGMGAEAISLLKTFRIIDDHPESGDSKLAAFSRREGSPPRVPDIYFYDRGDYCKMNLDYGGYLDALLDLAGVSNWQYLFCGLDLKTPERRHIYDSLKSTLGHLGRIFAKKDLTRYTSLLEGRAA